MGGLHLRGGWIGDEAPFYDRHYTGGLYSARGFEGQSLSPSGGDTKFWTASLEVRAPLIGDGRSPRLSGIAFLDVADGWTTDAPRLDDAHVSAGYGIRVRVPWVDIVGLDVGIPLTKNRATNRSASMLLSGGRFEGPAVRRRAPRALTPGRGRAGRRSARSCCRSGGAGGAGVGPLRLCARAVRNDMAVDSRRHTGRDRHYGNRAGPAAGQDAVREERYRIAYDLWEERFDVAWSDDRTRSFETARDLRHFFARTALWDLLPLRDLKPSVPYRIEVAMIEHRIAPEKDEEWGSALRAIPSRRTETGSRRAKFRSACRV